MPPREVHRCQCLVCSKEEHHPDKEIHHQFNLLLSRLDEQQRRWLVALESKRIGHGGDRLMAQVSGISVETIRRGRRELDENLRGRPCGRVRLPGAGRPRNDRELPTDTTDRRSRPNMKPLAKTLVVDDDVDISRTYRQTLSAGGYDVSVALTGSEALQKIEEDCFDVALVDPRISQDGGFSLIRAIRKAAPYTAVVVITGHASIENAKESIRLGVFDYVTKPFSPAMVREIVSQALACRHWTMESTC